MSLIRPKKENELNSTHVESQIFVHMYTVSLEAEKCSQNVRVDDFNCDGNWNVVNIKQL